MTIPGQSTLAKTYTYNLLSVIVHSSIRTPGDNISLSSSIIGGKIGGSLF